MNLNKNTMIRTSMISLAAFAMLGLGAPAFADDQHSRGGGSRTQSAGHAASAPQGRQQAMPRQAAPPMAQSAPQGRPMAQGRVAPQAGAPRAIAPGRPGVQAVPRGTSGYAVPRGSVAPGYSSGYAVPRGSVAPHYAAPYHYATPYHYAYPYYPHYHAVYRPYYYPYAYPYYAFHSHFTIGFGFYVGYPVAYPTWYNPYAVGTYGYGVPTGTPYGGLSFDMQPGDAAVFIDGVFIGAAADFGPEVPPLTLKTGLHHVELRADGYMPVAFDITVVPGQVIPYQGTMSAVR
jgi:hypothetical protein